MDALVLTYSAILQGYTTFTRLIVVPTNPHHSESLRHQLQPCHLQFLQHSSTASLIMIMMRLLTSSLQHTQVNSQHLGAAVVPLARRFLHPSTVTMGHGSHSSDNKPDIIEQEKQRNLTGKGERSG